MQGAVQVLGFFVFFFLFFYRPVYVSEELLLCV